MWGQAGVSEEDRLDVAEAGRVVRRSFRMLGPYRRMVIGALMLLVLWTLDNPFHAGMGGLRPVAMERTVQLIEEEIAIAGADDPVPCNAAGEPI